MRISDWSSDVCSSDLFDLVDGEGAPIANALVDIWLADRHGFYENQDPGQPEMNLRGRLRSDQNGQVNFWTIKPSCYPIPDDGPVGELLRIANRHAWRPAHIHVAISATGFAPVTSALVLAVDPYIDRDAGFLVKESLKVVCSASALLPPLGCHDSPVWELCHRIVPARLATGWWRPLFPMPFAPRFADTK